MIADIIILIVNLFITIVTGVIVWIINILPVSPFRNLNITFPTQLMGYINWIFPFGQALGILTAWATCVGVYFFVRWIMKIFKLA